MQLENSNNVSNREFHFRALFLLTILYVAAYILPLGLRDMMRPDEFRYGEIPREMIVNDNWVTPLLVGVRYFEKPALGYQWSALSMKLFGENAFAVRLPSALSVGLTALLIYMLCAQKCRDRRLAPLAAISYLSFGMVFGVGTFAVLDSQLSMAVSWCIGGYFLACDTEKKFLKFIWFLIAGIAAGAAFQFKGFLAFAVPVVVIVPYLIWQKQFKKMFTTPWLPLIAAVLVSLPWSIAIWKAEPDFWNYFFVEEHIKRFTASTYDRDPEPFWFFIPVLLAGALPGAFYYLAAWRGMNRQWLENRLVRYCLCWAVMPFLLFSISSCKTGTYILPCFPPLAVLLASALLSALQNYRSQTVKICMLINQFLSWLLIVGGLLGGTVLIVWRFKYVDKFPFFDPADPLPLLVALLLGIGGLSVVVAGKKGILRQLGLLLGILTLIFGWGSGLLLSERTNPQKMPENTFRDIYRKLNITADDVVAVDRGAASVTAWVLKRTDLPVVGRLGEFNYGFTNYPEEYSQRYYELDDIQRLLKDAGDKRVFYAIVREWSERTIPGDWKIRQRITDRGVTVVELEK